MYKNTNTTTNTNTSLPQTNWPRNIVEVEIHKCIKTQIQLQIQIQVRHKQIEPDYSCGGRTPLGNSLSHYLNAVKTSMANENNVRARIE